MKKDGVEGKEPFDKLHQEYKQLEQQWDSIKQSKPRITLHRYSSTFSSRSVVRNLQLLDNSPRDLMTSIQHRRSPSEGEKIWKVRTNDLGVQELIRERRAAIDSGKLKGRRLFDEAVKGVIELENSGGREEICSDCRLNLIKKSDEVRSSPSLSYDSDEENECENGKSKERLLLPVCVQCSNSCSSTSSTSICGEKVVEEEEEKVIEMVEEKRIARGDKSRGWMFTMVWLAIALIVCGIGINSTKSLGGYVNEAILVPT